MEKERAHLKEHGFVLIKNFMNADMIEVCKSFLDLSISSGIRTNESNPYLTGKIEYINPNIFVDSILLAYKNKIQNIFDTEMIPSYVFFREYFEGSALKVHKDRAVCEFSATILIDKNGEGKSSLCFCDDEQGTNSVEVIMEEGDAIIFSGSEEFGGRWHYRPPVEQKSITQAFLHYVSPQNRPEEGFPLPIHRSQ